MASSLVVERTARADVQMSNIAEVGDVRFLDDSHNVGLPGTSRSHCSPGKGKKRRRSASPILKKKFSVARPAPDHTSIEAALEKSLTESRARKNGHDRRNSPVFQVCYK